MIYGYQDYRKNKKKAKMRKLMLRSVGAGLAVIGIGGMLINGNNFAAITLTAVGIILFVVGREATNG